jgi:hypothetical protein
VHGEASNQRQPTSRPVVSGASQLSQFLAQTSSSIRHDLSSSNSDVPGLTRLLNMANADEHAWWKTFELSHAHPDGSERLRDCMA